jgi:hypothetical protein
MADHEPVEQHSQRSEMLFHCWLGMGARQILDIGRNVNQLYLGMIENPAAVAPAREATDSFVLGPPGVLVADIRRENFHNRSSAFASPINSAGGAASISARLAAL